MLLQPHFQPSVRSPEDSGCHWHPSKELSNHLGTAWSPQKPRILRTEDLGAGGPLAQGLWRQHPDLSPMALRFDRGAGCATSTLKHHHQPDPLSRWYKKQGLGGSITGGEHQSTQLINCVNPIPRTCFLICKQRWHILPDPQCLHETLETPKTSKNGQRWIFIHPALPLKHAIHVFSLERQLMHKPASFRNPHRLRQGPRYPSHKSLSQTLGVMYAPIQILKNTLIFPAQAHSHTARFSGCSPRVGQAASLTGSHVHRGNPWLPITSPLLEQVIYHHKP